MHSDCLQYVIVFLLPVTILRADEEMGLHWYICAHFGQEAHISRHTMEVSVVYLRQDHVKHTVASVPPSAAISAAVTSRLNDHSTIQLNKNTNTSSVAKFQISQLSPNSFFLSPCSTTKYKRYFQLLRYFPRGHHNRWVHMFDLHRFQTGCPS